MKTSLYTILFLYFLYYAANIVYDIFFNKNGKIVEEEEFGQEFVLGNVSGINNALQTAVGTESQPKEERDLPASLPANLPGDLPGDLAREKEVKAESKEEIPEEIQEEFPDENLQENEINEGQENPLENIPSKSTELDTTNSESSTENIEFEHSSSVASSTESSPETPIESIAWEQKKKIGELFPDLKEMPTSQVAESDPEELSYNENTPENAGVSEEGTASEESISEVADDRIALWRSRILEDAQTHLIIERVEGMKIYASTLASSNAFED